MKHLRAFDTQAEYDNAVLQFPNVSSIGDDEVIYSMGLPFYVEAIENISVKHAGEYSMDCKNWMPFNNSYISVKAGKKIFIRYIPKSYSSSSGTSRVYVNNGKCNVGGNVMSLLYGADYGHYSKFPFKSYDLAYLFKNQTNIVSAKDLRLPIRDLTGSNWCYSDMFYGCNSLTTAPALPATTLASYCYSGMFRGCTSLTTAPNLPATTITPGCYSGMFYGCNSLTTAPALPATTLASYCYSGMFYGCNSLTTAPALPATTLAEYCYLNMFNSCNSLTVAPTLPATTITPGCYSGMFQGCTSLTVAPSLPATTLANGCYSNMFNGCNSLTSAPALPATTLANNCYEYMFNGCTSLTAAPALLSTTLANYCYQFMFQGCTNLTSAPELPATTLVTTCYYAMFSGCTALTTAPSLPATTLADYCYHSMFAGCTNLTSTPELPATTLANYCYHSMFYGCTNLTSTPELPATTLANYCYEAMFLGCTSLNYIKCLCVTPPTNKYASNMLYNASSTGTFVKNFEAEWDSSVGTIPSGWTLVDNYTPQECTNLVITALDVSGRDTSTTISYEATTNGVDENGNATEVIVTGTVISETFPQNTSYTDTVEREISFTYMGVTATTTITQGVWVDQSCEVVLNDNWQMSTEISNPDSTTYDGVYESFSNKGKDNTAAIMYIDIVGYDTFGLYIRSNAESSYDYVMVSQLDKDINNDSSYSDTTLVKAHTRSKQNSGTAISNYTYVEFTGIDENEHRITIVYRKDSSQASGTDRGYVLIPKNQ